MFYDLNVPWTANQAENQQKIAFLAELGYNYLALSHTLSGKLPSTITCPIPNPLPFSIPAGVQLIRRTTLILSDASQNFRIPELHASSDILAVRPTDDKTLQHACHSLECDILSLDLSIRYHFRFKHKMFNDAISRGVRIELCYGATGNDVAARRNLIANATALIRATRGRGIVISSEAKDALAARGPWDAINLCVVWGLGQERGREAIDKEARSVVVAAKLRRTSYRGAVDVIYGGEKPEPVTKADPGKKGQNAKKTDGKTLPHATPKNDAKRKADAIAPSSGDAPLSNRAKKKLARQLNAGQDKAAQSQ